MTDTRRESAEIWVEDQISDAIIEGHELFGARRLTDAHLAGQECGEQRILDKLRDVVGDLCDCGAFGIEDKACPTDPCLACLVWNRVTGGEG